MKMDITKKQAETINLAISTVLMDNLGVERPELSADEQPLAIFDGEGLGDGVDIDQAVRTEIHNKSASEIVQNAISIVKSDLEGLQSKQDAYRGALDAFSKIEISNQSFSWVKSGANSRPLIEFDLKNTLTSELYAIVTYVVLLKGEEVLSEAVIEVPVRDETGGLRQSDSFEAKYQPTNDEWVNEDLKGDHDLNIAVRVVNFRMMDQDLAYEPFTKSDGERMRQLQRHAAILMGR